MEHNKKQDRRTRYTLSAIDSAFLDILKDKNVNSITVTDICKRADINRGTFYRYYRDVPDLYDKIENDFVDSICLTIEKNFSNSSEEGLYNILIEVLNILQENKIFASEITQSGNHREMVHKLISRMDTPIEI